MAAISVQDARIAQALARSKGLTYPLLPDPEHRVIDAYGVYDEHEKFSLPALFVIDPEGKVVFGRVGVAHGPFHEHIFNQAIGLIQSASR